METSDWRTKLTKDFRGKVVGRIVDTIMKHNPPCEDPSYQLDRIQIVATKLEEKVLMDSRDQNEYLRRISVKLKTAVGSRPNGSQSSSNLPGVGLKTSNLDQPQSCETSGQHSLLDVQNNIRPAGVASNLPSKNPYSLKPERNSNLYKQVKQDYVAAACTTQQHNHHQSLLTHTSQQVPQQSVIQAPLLRPSDKHFAPVSDQWQDQSSSFNHTVSVIKNHHQNVSSTSEQAQSQKKPHSSNSTLTPANLQQPQHCNLPLQHNSLLQDFKGKSIVRSSARHETQINHIPVRHGNSQLPEGKYQHEIKIHQETRQTDFTLMHDQVQELQPQNRERQQTQSQYLPGPGRMQRSEIPEATYGQGISNVDNLHQEVYQKVETLKCNYLPSLTGLEKRIASYFQKLHSFSEHPERNDIKKINIMKDMHQRVKCYIVNLNVAKDKITLACREKIGLLEKSIVSLLRLFEQRKHATLLQDGRPSDVHSMLQTVQLHSQAPQGQVREEEKKLQPESVNLQCFDTKMQHGNVPSVVKDSDFLSEPPTLQHDMVHMRQKLTEKVSNSLKLVNQVTSGSFNLPIRSPQKSNNMLSQNPGSRLQSHVNPLESSFNTLQDMHLKHSNEQSHIRYPEQEPQTAQTHQSQQQLLQLNQQIPQRHHQPLELQSKHFTHIPLPESHKPSSRQAVQRSSVIEKNHLPMLPIKPKSPVISRISPEAGMSSSVSLISASRQGNSEKPMSETVLASQAVNIGCQQADGASEAVNCSSDGSKAAEEPIQRLIKAVSSMSSKAASSIASDISSVTFMTDRLSGPDTVPSSGTEIKDLADETNFHLQMRYSALQEMSVGRRIMKRRRSTPISFGDPETAIINESLSHLDDLEKYDSNSSANTYRKRRRLEANRLQEEITKINQRLIDAVLDIWDEDTVSAASIPSGEGIVVRCSFKAVAFSPSMKAELERLPIQPLQLLVPANYPFCSPIFVDKSKVEVSDDQDLSTKVTLKFSLALLNLTEPLSLGEIARTWEVCVRAVITEYAEQHGGGSFSSMYGSWEDTLRSAAAA